MAKHTAKKLTEKEQINLILQNYQRKDVDLIPSMHIFSVQNLYPIKNHHTLDLSIMFQINEN